MNILIVGEFSDRDNLVRALQNHYHFVVTVTNAESGFSLLDNNEITFALIFAAQGNCGMWMGTTMLKGLKERKLNTALVFIVEGHDDSLELWKLQLKLQAERARVLTMHPPFFLSFVADQLGSVSINVFEVN